MKILSSSLLLVWTILCQKNGVNGQSARSVSRRTFMTVEYDYKIEVNSSQIEELGYNISTTKPLEYIQREIDSNIIRFLQTNLPNGGVPEGNKLPDVKYNNVASRFISMCYTESDVCKWVKSRINLSFAGKRPLHAVERVTLNLVKDFLESTDEQYSIVNTTYAYPMIYSSSVRLHISPMHAPMTDPQIGEFVDSFYNVFQAIISENDGDTELSEAYYVYQDVTELEGKQNETAYELSVDLKYYGKCRDCFEEELLTTVDGTVEKNADTFLRQLQTSNTLGSYFETADLISVSTPFSRDVPMEDDSVYETTVHMVSKKVPWALYGGIIAAILVLGIGVYVIAKDQRDLKKEEASTEDESSEDEGVPESTSDPECLDSIDNESGAVSQDLSTDSEAHSNYEVYVY